MEEWQTRRPQKALSERTCGFESHPPHCRSKHRPEGLDGQRPLGRQEPRFGRVATAGRKFFVKAQYFAENRPLVGPLGVEGAFACGALSGFGIMASHVAAELLAAHVTGDALPEYAGAFLPVQAWRRPLLSPKQTWAKA